MKYLVLATLFSLFLMCCNDKDERRIVKKYYKNGNLKSEYQVLLDSINDGYSKVYFENGQLKSFISYKNGRRNGEAYFYNQEGNLEEKYLYHLDTMYHATFYDKAGKVDKQGYYVTYISSPDTLYLGDTIQIKAFLWNQVGELDASTVPYRDKDKETRLETFLFNERYIYEFFPQKSGVFYTRIQLTVNDSFQAGWYGFHKKYYVLPRR